MSSFVAFAVQNKVMILKVFFIIILGAGAFYVVKINNPLRDKPDVLGKAIAGDVSKKSEPAPPANPLKAIEEQVSSLIDTSVRTTKEATSDVLGIASQIVKDTASKSADTITKNVIQSAAEVIVKQIEKLPEKEQEEVKKNICK